MSKMAELDLEIQELLDEGLRPTSVAGLLKVPLEMVYEVIERELVGEPELIAEIIGLDDGEDDDWN